MRALVSLILPLLLIAMPAGAAETRSAPEGHVPPPATVEGLDWLTGRWVGGGIGGARAQETYSAPAGGSIAGHFVQEDGEGGIAFFEIMQIAEENGSLVYRLKHFNGDLTGWEEKAEVVSFPLVAIEEGALYFDGLTVRKDGEDGLLGAVQVRQDDGTVEELVFRYERAGTDGGQARCPDAYSTPEINACLSEILAAADEQRARYFAAALARNSEQGELLDAMRRANAAFEAYRDAECRAMYEKWRTGTIRGAMELSCRIALTGERTHVVWQNWLTYPDSTRPTLPEP